jgi:hypothetical protein
VEGLLRAVRRIEWRGGLRAAADPFGGGYREDGQAVTRRRPVDRPRVDPLIEAGDRVIKLYESWGKKEKAAEWRATLGLAELPADPLRRNVPELSIKSVIVYASRFDVLPILPMRDRRVGEIAAANVNELSSTATGRCELKTRRSNPISGGPCPMNAPNEAIFSQVQLGRNPLFNCDFSSLRPGIRGDKSKPFGILSRFHRFCGSCESGNARDACRARFPSRMSTREY